MEFNLQVKTAIQMPNTDHMMHVKCLVNLYIWLRVHLNPYTHIYIYTLSPTKTEVAVFSAGFSTG